MLKIYNQCDENQNGPASTFDSFFFLCITWVETQVSWKNSQWTLLLLLYTNIPMIPFQTSQIQLYFVFLYFYKYFVVIISQ